MPSWVTPYTGQRVSSLPPGFMEAAARLGQMQQQGYQALGQGLAGGIDTAFKAYAENKAKHDYLNAKYEAMMSDENVQKYIKQKPEFRMDGTKESELLKKGQKFQDMSATGKAAFISELEFYREQAWKKEQFNAELAQRNRALNLQERGLAVDEKYREFDAQQKLEEARRKEAFDRAMGVGIKAAMDRGPTVSTRQVESSVNLPPEALEAYMGRDAAMNYLATLPSAPVPSADLTPALKEAAALRAPFVGEGGNIVRNPVLLPEQKQRMTDVYQQQSRSQADPYRLSKLVAMAASPFIGGPAVIANEVIKRFGGRPSDEQLRNEMFSYYAQNRRMAEAQGAIPPAALQALPVAVPPQGPIPQAAPTPVAPVPVPPLAVPATRQETMTTPATPADRLIKAFSAAEEAYGGPLPGSIAMAVQKQVQDMYPQSVVELKDLGNGIKAVMVDGKPTTVIQPPERKPDEESRQFTEPTGWVGEAPSAAEAKEFRTAVKDAALAISGVNQLEEMLKTDKWKRMTDYDKRAQAQVISTKLQAALRIAILGPGTVQEREREILRSLTPDPTKVFSLDSATQTKLKLMREGIIKDINAQAKVYNLKETGGIEKIVQALEETEKAVGGQERVQFQANPATNKPGSKAPPYIKVPSSMQ